MVRQLGFGALAFAASVFAGGAQAATFSIASETGSGHVTQALGSNFNPTGFSNCGRRWRGDRDHHVYLEQ